MMKPSKLNLSRQGRVHQRSSIRPQNKTKDAWMKTALRLSLATFLLWGCGQGISPTDTAKVDAAFARYPDSEGKTIFREKCGKCHKYRIPEMRTAEQWPGIIDRMAKKAKLTDDQKAAVLDFVKSNAKAS